MTGTSNNNLRVDSRIDRENYGGEDFSPPISLLSCFSLIRVEKQNCKDKIHNKEQKLYDNIPAADKVKVIILGQDIRHKRKPEIKENGAEDKRRDAYECYKNSDSFRLAQKKREKRRESGNCKYQEQHMEYLDKKACEKGSEHKGHK